MAITLTAADQERHEVDELAHIFHDAYLGDDASWRYSYLALTSWEREPWRRAARAAFAAGYTRNAGTVVQ